MSFYLQTNVGFLDSANKYCIDWNCSGLFAYANHYTINIVEASSMKIIQTLENSKVCISKLKWSEANVHDNQMIKPVFKLAAADEHGMISIWNTFESKLINELIDSTNSSISGSKVIGLNWKLLSNKKEVIMALYSGNNKLIVWDPQFGIKLWSKNFTANIFHLAIDPHQYGRVAFLGNNFVELILQCFDDETNRTEKNSIRVSLLSEMNEAKAKEAGAGSTEADKKNSFVILNRYFKSEDQDNKLKSSQANNQPIQVEFHSIYKNILLILYPREILFFDLFISQIIGQIQLEKNQSPFTQIYTASQKDVLFVLHENGCITVRSKQESAQNTELFGNQSEPIGNAFKKIEFNFNYPICAQSDNIRLSKNSKVFGFSVCPTTQKSITVLVSDGRVLKFDLFKKLVFTKKSDLIKYKKTAPENVFLFDLFKKQGETDSLKIILAKMINATASRLYISKMCPPLTKRNSKYWEPIMAIGCPTGNLVIYNILKNCAEKKITTLNNSMLINGIEWISYFSVITWSYYSNQFGIEANFGSSETSSQHVRNDIFLTDLRTGETRRFRENQKEESPIIQIKLSNSKQYLVILFKEQPFEIWDIRTFSLIKKISKKSPTIKILEWCSIDFKKCDQKQQDTEAGSDSLVKCQSEHFICIDNNDLMYSFSVENNIIKDGGKVLPEDGLLTHIAAVSIKKDLIVFGDTEGNLSVWNIRLKSSKVISNKQNPIRKIKFAPGKENFLLMVLFGDFIRIYEIKSGDLISTFKAQNNKTQEILDCEWCASDKLAISFSNGCISMFDMFFKRSIDERKYLLSISSHKVVQPLNDFLRNIYLAKRFYFQTVDVLLEEPEFNDFKNLTSIIDQYSNKNQSLGDFLKETSSPLKSLLLSISSNSQPKSIVKKASAFSKISLFLNLCKFETQFWTYLAYLFNDKEQGTDLYTADNDLFYDITKKNEFLLKIRDFRQRQYEFCKLYKEKDVVSNAVVQRDLLLCNEQNLVFNLLTEADDLNSSYKACLISSLQNTPIHPDSQTNIKLVATNLIINGKIEEGIELLCLIGLTFDACRYLQDNGNWEKAAWLAKLRLPEIEYVEIIKRWVDYLCIGQQASNNLEFAVLLLLSCRQYSRALDLLSDSIYTELNYFFLELCLENQLVTVCEDIATDLEETEEASDEKSTRSVFRHSGKNSTVISSALETKIKNNYEKLQVF